MDFGYSPDQQALQDEVRHFIAEHFTQDVRDEIEGRGDEEGRGPLVRELYKQIGERGWIGITWPKEYGGQEKPARPVHRRGRILPGGNKRWRRGQRRSGHLGCGH